MVDEWDRRYEEYLSVPADIEEKKRRFHSGSEEIDHTNLADLFRDGRLVWQRPTFLDEEVAPSFLTPLNDIFMEWIYTIDLEQEVFSVNNRTHYHLANLPGKDHWCFIDDQGCNNLPKDIPAEYLTSLTTAEISSDIALSQCNLTPRQLVRAKGLGCIPWSKRHSAIYRTLLFSEFRAQKGLSGTLLEWQAGNFAFREVIYALLYIAVGGKYLTASPDHLTRDIVYWFNGALVTLKIRLRDVNVLERGLQQVVQYRQQYHCSSFNAILMSIEHVVLVKVFANGQIEHTEVMALFWVERDMSMEAHEAPSRDPAEVMQQEVSNTPAEEPIDTNREVEQHSEQRTASAASLSNHPITTSDPKRTFQALITFFDAIALEHMRSATNSQGRFPNEIYALIIQHVLDAPTRHACTQVSPTFQDLCLQNYLIGDNTLLLPSETCIPCTEPSTTPQWLLTRDTLTGTEKRVAVLSEDDCSGFHARKWFREETMRVLVGCEFNRRSLLPFGFKFWSLDEGEGESERGYERELKADARGLGWMLRITRSRRR
ncbi:MAG: hypothetical protein Q9215_005056 [Flavoplaca cf. flavocitrina]